MTRPAQDPVTDGETADRQFGQRLARRWGATAQSDRRRSAIRISARKMRVFAVTGGRARLGQLAVPRATQQAVSATVASTEDQPIAPPSGAPEALQIWREREQAALEAELAEQQAHEEAVERASRRRALRTATRQLPATEARTPGSTAAGISPREIKVARPADVAAIGRLPAQPKLNANMHAAPVGRPTAAAATSGSATAQARPVRAPAGPVDTKRSVVGRSDADDDSEDDTRATGTEVKTGQPWRSAQAQTVSATLQQSALNATAAQTFAPGEDGLGLAHLFNTDDADAEPIAEGEQPPHTPQTPPAALALRQQDQQQSSTQDEDDDLGGAFANLFGEDPEEPPAGESPDEVPQQPTSQQFARPKQQQPKATPLVRRPGSMWGADADPANPDLDDDVVDADDDDLGSAFANLFDENLDETRAELTGVDEADDSETDTSPEPQSFEQRPQQPKLQQPKQHVQQPKRPPLVRRPGSMWDAYADPANPVLDEAPLDDEDEDLAPAFANLFDESPEDPEAELTSLDEPHVDRPLRDQPPRNQALLDEPEPDTGTEPEPQTQTQTQTAQRKPSPPAQQPKRPPVLRRPGSMWDADADPANPDLDDDVAEDDDDLGSAFTNLFDESPDEAESELAQQPEAQQPQQPTPPRTVPAWDEADASADGDADDDDLGAAFTNLFDEETRAPQQPTPTAVQRSLTAPAEGDEGEDEQGGFGLDGLFEEGEDTPPAPAPQRPASVQPPPAWRATPPSARSARLVQPRQLALPTAAAATALLDAPPSQPKRVVALRLAHARSTSIAMPEMLTSKRAAGWMTATRALSTSLAAPQLIQPATMPQTGGTTGGAFLRDVEAPTIDQPDAAPADAALANAALPERAIATDPAVVPDIVRQNSSPPRMSVRDLVAFYERGAEPADAASPFAPMATTTTAAAGAPTGTAATGTAATRTAAGAGLLANLPRALTVAPPRISVQPDQPTLGQPEAIAPTASPVPSATRPASTPAAGTAAADAAFSALATKIVGPPKPPGARPALPTPTGGPLVSPQQSTTPRVIRRRRGDNVPQPAEAPQAAFPELNQGTQTERLDALVDRVVERIEQRVIDELERRGRRHSRGVF
jgi:hypothetical protein